MTPQYNDAFFNDIIDLPHFHAPDKPYMSMHDRAAQFAPFKSLGDAQDEIAQEE